jgi:hypothetical protein
VPTPVDPIRFEVKPLPDAAQLDKALQAHAFSEYFIAALVSYIQALLALLLLRKNTGA